MDTYEEMASFYLSHNEEPEEWLRLGWSVERIAKFLKWADENGQLIATKDEAGSVRSYVAWIYVEDERRERLLKDHYIFITNLGNKIFPMFVASSEGVRGMRKMGRMLMKVSKNLGREIWAFRRNAIIELGGN